MKKVMMIMGSESDKNIADKAVDVLEKYSIPYDLQVASAHRNPSKVRELVRDTDADVFICIAGLSAALSGFVASITPKPVIGVPVDVKLGGLDALLSTVQTPPGVPVATVGIDNGKNAAYLALRILANKYPEILSTEPSTTVTTTTQPDFMTSTTPEFPAFFSETPSTEETKTEEEKKEPRGDWLS